MKIEPAAASAPHCDLLTFDIFGTVVDWRKGLVEALACEGYPNGLEMFDAVMDWQIWAEQSDPDHLYTGILAESLSVNLGIDADSANRVASTMNRWPPFPDSPAAISSLLQRVPCVAMTNSDREHGPSVQSALGVQMSDWICAEEVGYYKPDHRMWLHTASQTGVEFGPHWWHVSAYADYDLGPARELGLTCVMVRRPHCRPGPADIDVPDLTALADLVRSATVERDITVEDPVL